MSTDTSVPKLNGQIHQSDPEDTGKNIPPPTKVVSVEDLIESLRPYIAAGKTNGGQQGKQNQWRFDKKVSAADVVNGLLLVVAVTTIYFAWRSLSLAEDTASKQLRAYVSVVEGRVSWQPTQAVMSLTIRNSGQTPSSNTRVTVETFELVRNDIVRTGALFTKENVPLTLASGEKCFVKKLMSISRQQKREIMAGSLSIRVKGTVTYTDIFKVAQSESFDLTQGVPYVWDDEFMGMTLAAQ